MGEANSTVRAALVDAVVAALPVAVVYFSGWAYLSSYLGEFGIDATQVEVAFSTVLVYAFIPLQNWKVLAYFTLLAALVYALTLVPEVPAWRKNLLNLVAGFFALGLLFLVSWAAKEDAYEMATYVWKGEKSQTVPVLSAADQSKPPYPQFKACIDRRQVRQIIGLPEQLFLLCRSPESPCVYGTMIVVGKDGTIIYTANRVRKPENDNENCPK